MFIVYEHHKRKVWVRKDLKGTHREHCLCYSCQRFPASEKCPIAQALYEFDVQHGLTTPVYECPNFLEI
jgi:hypothetical protein